MATTMDSSLSAEVGKQLQKAQKKIADLLEDIGQLSDELQKKDSLLATFKSRLPTLSSWLETSQAGELHLHNAAATLRDIVVWEPPSTTCPRPSCSTPSEWSHWSEVVVRSRKRAPGGAPYGTPSSFSIPLTNKYSALSMSKETPVRAPDQGTAPVDPDVSPPTDAVPPLTDTTAFPPLSAACAPVDGHPAPGHSPPSSRPSTERRRLLRDAVRWHSRRPPHREWHHPRALDGDDRVTGSATGLATPPGQQATTLVIGDSILHNVRLRGAFTLSFPGTTVMDITEKIPSILGSHPQLLNKLLQSQLSVFISGPTPTCGRGIGRFSRLLSLNTWLSSACCTHNVGFIDNFDVFWERRHLFGSDGLHLNRAGSRVLSGR
ncbi:hypothetical protein N1851_021807 [Merluccius polli]|uniref:Uncharacterized protein n=1 Tax=Merluccius polli TaxID=89951 RepID=A0AA47MJF5_MERPO|nr:hypothetical protein N1851_021807 [Merluccius polli]